jgi:hypothetical protein
MWREGCPNDQVRVLNVDRVKKKGKRENKFRIAKKSFFSVGRGINHMYQKFFLGLFLLKGTGEMVIVSVVHLSRIERY